MLQSRDQERPPPGAPGLCRDLFFLRRRKPTVRRPLQGRDIQLDLLREQSVDGSPQLEELIDRRLPLFKGYRLGDLGDQ